MERNEQQRAVQNMLQQAKGGNSEAVHDLVDFARNAPPWCFQDVVKTLAELLTSNETDNSLRAAIESLRGTYIYSRVQDEVAIERLVRDVRRGDLKALSDLVRLAMDWSWAKHEKVIEALVDVLTNKISSRQQREAVESLRDHAIFQEITKRQRERGLLNLMQAVRSGSMDALKDLVQIAQSGKMGEMLEDSRIAEALAHVFFSATVDRRQPSLIWSLRDQTVYTRTWTEMVWETFEEIGHDGERRSYTKECMVSRRQDYTFWEYIQEYCGPELEIWLAKERDRR